MLQLLGGNSRVLGIDVDIRTHNRRAIESHPMFERIDMLEGSPVGRGRQPDDRDPRVPGNDRSLVIDERMSAKLLLSNAPSGYLRCVHWTELPLKAGRTGPMTSKFRRWRPTRTPCQSGLHRIRLASLGRAPRIARPRCHHEDHQRRRSSRRPQLSRTRR